MPIAFDPPAHAPHGTVPARAARAQDEDAGIVDAFTQFLLAASAAPQAAKPDAPAGNRKEPANTDASAVDAPFLMLPLPAAPALATPVPGQVTIVATEKRIAMTPALLPVQTVAASTPGAATLPTASPTGANDATAADPAGPHAPGRRAVNIQDAAPDVLASAANARADTPQPKAPLVAALAANAAIDKATSAKPLDERATPAIAALDVTAAHTAGAPAVHVDTVAAPAFTPGWQDETVAKLAHIVVTRNERAELRLDPAELGPVSIRVDMQGDHASMTIVAASPDTRSALEQSLPQLRDLLSSQGITLGQATVHDGSAQRDPAAQAWSGAAATRNDAPGDTIHAAEAVQRFVRRADRLVDVFA
ncbi:MAG TPA: flagellar hook-length control protein FliK [Casimicrobiaceae bacterium]|jgi:flagellar hook-length control protein FliK